MDFILSRYHDPSIILNMDFMDGLMILEKGIEKHIEERAFQRWLVDYHRFMHDEKSFIPFDQYFHSITGQYGSRQAETRKEKINKQVWLTEKTKKLMKMHKEAIA